MFETPPKDTWPSAVSDDRRRDREHVPSGYVVCTDSFLSGWGQAPGRSFYALAVDSTEEIDIVMANAEAREEMKRVRFNLDLPRLRDGDHLAIVDRHGAPEWYRAGAFAKKCN